MTCDACKDTADKYAKLVEAVRVVRDHARDIGNSKPLCHVQQANAIFADALNVILKEHVDGH